MQILIALLSPHKYEDSRFSAKICARCERGIRHLLSYDKLDALNIRFYCCVRVKHFQHDQMLSIAAGNQAVAGGGGGRRESQKKLYFRSKGLNGPVPTAPVRGSSMLQD